MKKTKRPTIGLALSGASTRSVFYIGFLEVLQEQNIKIDYISATSSSSIVAAAFACGTLEKLKKVVLNLNRKLLFSLIGNDESKSGFYNMDRVGEVIRQFTLGKNFADVRPFLEFVSTDIERGEQVVLSMGDIAKAACASCVLPGIFEPIMWGNKPLVDGGIVSVIPGDVAKKAGCDIVIGFDLRTTPFVFEKWEIKLGKFYQAYKKLFSFNYQEWFWSLVRLKRTENASLRFFHHSTLDEGERKMPSMLGILSKAINIAEKSHTDSRNILNQYFCDILVRPPLSTLPLWKRFLYLNFTDFKSIEKVYILGRTTALEQLPKIRQLINEKSK